MKMGGGGGGGGHDVIFLGGAQPVHVNVIPPNLDSFMNIILIAT